MLSGSVGALRLGYHAIIGKPGIPTAKIDPNFRSPSGRPYKDFLGVLV